MMEFSTLLVSIIPLYIMIFVGYLVGKFLKVNTDDFGKTMFFIMSPIIICHGVSQTNFNSQSISIPLLIWLISTFSSISVYYSTSFLFREKDGMRNMLAFSTGTSAMGLYGLPIAMCVLGNDQVAIGIYIAACTGMMVFENTSGFYWITKGKLSKKEYIKKLISLPALHATILGFILSALEIKVNDTGVINNFVNHIRSAYMVFGMMVVGMGLSKIEKFEIDWKMVFLTIMTKYIMWPAMVLSIVFIDKNFTHFYNQTVYKSMIILAIVPISVTNVILASVYKYPADRISVVVLINILIALLYIPFMIDILL